MSTAVLEPKLTIEASDVSGQKRARALDVPRDAAVTELIHGFISRMGLPRNTVDGDPIDYQALLEREGRHLRGAERVGESLRDQDRLVLQPNIEAGAARRE